MGGEGFEPTKPKQQIYSLSHLTTLETSLAQDALCYPFAGANIVLFYISGNRSDNKNSVTTVKYSVTPRLKSFR